MTDQPLRLAIDIGPLYGHRTGVGVATGGIVDALSDRGDIALDPYLVSFRSRPDDTHRKLPIPGILASHLWSRSDRPAADRWLDDDVVHGTNYVAPPSRHPTVVSVYDCWFLRHPELAAPVVRRAARTLRRVVARGGWIHASSTATAREAAELLDTDRVATVHLGPPTASPAGHELAPPACGTDLAGRPYVVAIGTEERRKDLPLLVGAFRELADRHDDVRLVLAGAEGDQSTEVTGAIEAAGADVARRIHRLGPIGEHDKQWLLRQATALAYPSLDEGFGFPILEAQLAGTPVVARAVGAVPEIAGDGAVLVAERDAGLFADALDRVLTDGALRLGLLESGNRNLLRFSWAEAANGLIDLYTRAREAT